MMTLDRRGLLAGLGSLAGGAILVDRSRAAQARLLAAQAGPASPVPSPAADPGDSGPGAITCCDPRRAVQSLPGSSSSLHVISEPGSYFLRGNLTADGSRHGIEIASSNVTLDLFGFALIGRRSSWGIWVSDPNLKNITVQNGAILNWTRGIFIDITNSQGANAHRFLGLDFAENSEIAAQLTHGTILSHCTAARDGAGLNVGGDSAVLDCVASDSNPGWGMATGKKTIVLGCTVTRCGAQGIYSDGENVIAYCSVQDNVGPGIWIGNGERLVAGDAVIGCVLTGNGIGILLDHADGCLVQSNSCAKNRQAGILARGRGHRLDGNHLWANDPAGVRVDSPGNLVVRNSVGGSSQNYVIVGDNGVGPILQLTDLDSCNPHANYDLG